MAFLSIIGSDFPQDRLAISIPSIVEQKQTSIISILTVFHQKLLKGPYLTQITTIGVKRKKQFIVIKNHVIKIDFAEPKNAQDTINFR